MPDAAEKFIHAALAAAPGDNEVRQHLAAELTTLAATAGDPSLEEATRLLKEGRLSRSNRRIWFALAIAATLIAGVCMALNARPFYTYRQGVAQMLGYWGGKLTMPDHSAAPGLPDPSHSQRLLLLGDPGRQDQPDQFQGLTASNPSNPDYYAAFARKYIYLGNKVPPDFEARVRATDPGNGMLFLTAMQAGSKAVRKDKAANRYEITDPIAFAEAMRYFHLAAASSLLRDRIEDIAGERLAALPPARDFLSVNLRSSFLISQEGIYSSFSLSTSRILCAAAQKCDADHDPEAFRRLAAEWRAVCIRLAEAEPVSLIDLLLKRAAITETSKVFATIATDLGMNDESAYYSRLGASLVRLKQEIEASHREAEKTSSYTSADSLVAHSIGMLVPPAPASDLVPSRLALHACAQRLTAFLGCAAFLLTAAGVAAYRFRGSLMARSLARLSFRMTWREITPRTTLAALLPLLLFQFHVWSAWGATHWNVFWGGLLLANLQALAALFLALLLPLLLSRRILRAEPVLTSAAHLFPAGDRLACGAAILCCALAWILAAIAPRLSGFDALFTHDLRLLAGVGKPELAGACGVVLQAAGALLAVAAAYLLFVAFRALISSRARLPRRLATAQLLLPPYLAALLFLGLLQPVLESVESQWATHDPLGGVDPAHPAVERSEHRIMAPTYARLRQLLQEAAESS